MNEVTIPLKIQGIAQIKAELRELKGELANATDPEQVARLSQQAGVLSDKIKDANDQVKVFASGSKFEQVSNGFAGITDSLRSLDFAEASDKAKVFSTTLGSLNPKDLKKGFTDFTSMLGTLGKAFVKLGVTILMNPIFLIVAAVVAIIAVVALVLNAFGFLDDVLKVLMAPINALIAGFKMLTDWLGLTAYAAEDQAARSMQAMEKAEKKINTSTTIKTQALDRQISIDKASGKSTAKAEEYRSNLIIAAARKNYALKIKAFRDEQALGDWADNKKLASLRTRMLAERKILLDEIAFKKVAEIKANTGTKREKEKPEPKQKNTELEAVQKAQAEAQEYMLTLTMTAIEKELHEVNKKYTALIASAKKFKLDTKDLEIAQMNAENEIALKDAAAKKEKTETDKKNAADKAAAEIAIEDAKYNELQRLTAANEQDKIKQVQLFVEYDKLIAQQAYDEKIKDLKEGDALLIAETTALQLQLAQITKDGKQKELAITKEAEEKKRAEIKKTTDAAIDFAEKSVSAITAINDISMSAKLAKVKKGSKEEEALLKKQFTLNKKLQLASAVIDAGKAITSILAQYPKFDGGFAMAAALGFSAITSATTIAKIAATTFESPGSPDAVDSGGLTAVAPSGPQLFGQANTGNDITAGGGGSTNMTVTAVVSETEITATQHHINNIQQNSQL